MIEDLPQFEDEEKQFVTVHEQKGRFVLIAPQNLSDNLADELRDYIRGEVKVSKILGSETLSDMVMIEVITITTFDVVSSIIELALDDASRRYEIQIKNEGRTKWYLLN